MTAPSRHKTCRYCKHYLKSMWPYSEYGRDEKGQVDFTKERVIARSCDMLLQQLRYRCDDAAHGVEEFFPPEDFGCIYFKRWVPKDKGKDTAEDAAALQYPGNHMLGLR